MKKLNLLVLTPLVIATAGTSVAFANNSSTSLELSTAVTANTNLFFKNTYEIKSLKSQLLKSEVWGFWLYFGSPKIIQMEEY